MARNYDEEYKDYHGKQSEIDNRNDRNKARRKKKLSKGDPREVDHKDGNPNNNSDSNLRAVSQKTNRKKGAKPMPEKQEGVDAKRDEKSNTDTPSPEVSSVAVEERRTQETMDTLTAEDNVLNESMRNTGAPFAAKFGSLLNMLAGGGREGGAHPVQDRVFGQPEAPQMEQPLYRPPPGHDPLNPPPQQVQDPRYGGEPMEYSQPLYRPPVNPTAPNIPLEMLQQQGGAPAAPPSPMFRPEPGSQIYDAVMNPNKRGSFNLTPDEWRELEKRVYGL